MAVGTLAQRGPPGLVQGPLALLALLARLARLAQLVAGRVRRGRSAIKDIPALRVRQVPQGRLALPARKVLLV